MPQAEQLPAPLNSDRMFVGLFLAAYGLLLVDLLLGQGLAVAWPKLLLGVAFVLVGTLGFERVRQVDRPALTHGYFALMVPMGASLFASSVTGGTFFLLVVAAQAIRVLSPAGAFLVGLPMPLLHATMAWPHSLRESATFLVALVFLYVLSRAILDAERARAALAVANQQLRAYAAQREELAAERERNRIAREIHDGLGHYLTTIHMQLQAARAILDRDRPRAEATLVKAQRLAQAALGDVRHSVAALRSEPAEHRALPQLLAALAEDAEHAGLAATLAVHGEPRPLGHHTEQTLLRAAQEGLTNVRKHAAAERVALTLDYRLPSIVRLCVRDDGRGAQTAGAGFGLVGLRERAQQLGGRLEVVTAPGAGFTLTMEVPG
jgi:signal transduction histidine kinase